MSLAIFIRKIGPVLIPAYQDHCECLAHGRVNKYGFSLSFSFLLPWKWGMKVASWCTVFLPLLPRVALSRARGAQLGWWALSVRIHRTQQTSDPSPPTSASPKQLLNAPPTPATPHPGAAPDSSLSSPFPPLQPLLSTYVNTKLTDRLHSWRKAADISRWWFGHVKGGSPGFLSEPSYKKLFWGAILFHECIPPFQ